MLRAMRTGVTIRLEPTDQPRPEVLQEVYDEVWDLTLKNVQTLVRGKTTRDIAKHYLADSRTDGCADEEGLTFVFYEGEGCDIPSSICRHWMRVSIASMREGLDAVLAPLGYRLTPESVEEARRHSDRFMEVKGVALRVVSGEDGPRLLGEGGTNVDVGGLSKAMRGKAEKVAAGPLCLCELCRKLDAGKGPIDAVATRADAPPSPEFTSLSKALRHARHARTLSLYQRHLAELPPEVGRLAWLETLYIWENLLKELPDQIGGLRRLRTLNAGGNHYLTRLPEQLGELEALEELNLSGAYSLRALPEGMRRLRNLKRLNLASSSLRGLPDWFAGLEQLETLSLYEVPLQELPMVLLKLPNLRHLDLRDTAPHPFLEGADPAIVGKYRGEQSLLRQATAAGGGDHWLQFPFDEMPVLKTLQLRGVCEMPEAVLRCDKLLTLDIGPHHERPPLPPLPDDIGNLRALTRLSYDGSTTKELPDSLFDLDLRELNLERGAIEVIPDAIARLTHLRDFRVGYNPIREVSERLLECRAIEYLSLRDHKMAELPPGLRELPALKSLWE